MNKRDFASSRFEQGFYCSQAVFSAFAEELDLDRDAALKIATAFGAGMGGMAETCGAVTGAFMVIGLKHGMSDIEYIGAKEKTAELVQEFAQAFEARNKTIVCKELLPYDISILEELERAREDKVFSNGDYCPKFIKDAVEILEELL